MRLKVLVRTTRAELTKFLEQRLAPGEYQIVAGSLDAPIMDQVLEQFPDILLFELAASESPENIVLHKIRKVHPYLKVIFLSQHSTPEDARIVEQGLFYYTAMADVEEILEVIQAAARAIQKEKRRGSWE